MQKDHDKTVSDRAAGQIPAVGQIARFRTGVRAGRRLPSSGVTAIAASAG